jgi:hypothetical protein
MKFRFIGTYTNGHTSISACGFRFDGHEPTDVDGAEAIRRLSGSVEFEVVHPLDHDGDGEKGGSLPDAVAPRRRGRKPKAAQ